MTRNGNLLRRSASRPALWRRTIPDRQRLKTGAMSDGVCVRPRIDERIALAHFKPARALEFHGMGEDLGFLVRRALRFDFRGQRAVVVAIGDFVFRHGKLLPSPRSVRQFDDEALRVKRNFRHGFHELS